MRLAEYPRSFFDSGSGTWTPARARGSRGTSRTRRAARSERRGRVVGVRGVPRSGGSPRRNCGSRRGRAAARARAPRKRAANPLMPRSASGSATTHAPAPSAAAIARRRHYVAEPVGISSTTTTATNIPSAIRVAGHRRDTVSHASEGASAPVADDWACDRETEDESPPTLAVGHPSDDQRVLRRYARSRAGTRLGRGRSIPRFVGGERDRLGEEGVEVADDQRHRGAEHPECGRARGSRRSGGAHHGMPSVSWLRSVRRVVAREEPEVRHRSEYSIVSTVSHPPCGRRGGSPWQRATVRGERAVLLTHLVDDVSRRLEQAHRVARRSG